MTETCACCGRPTDRVEEHHVNERKGDNHPDNLSPRDRRCHMQNHGNERAVDRRTERRYGPPSMTAGPAK